MSENNPTPALVPGRLVWRVIRRVTPDVHPQFFAMRCVVVRLLPGARVEVAISLTSRDLVLPEADVFVDYHVAHAEARRRSDEAEAEARNNDETEDGQ